MPVLASCRKLELTRFSTLPRIQDKAKCGKGTELMGGGEVRQHYWGGRRTFFLDGGNNWGRGKRTPGGRDTVHTWGWEHLIERDSLAGVGGWVGGGGSKLDNNATCQILSLAENPRWS